MAIHDGGGWKGFYSLAALLSLMVVGEDLTRTESLREELVQAGFHTVGPVVMAFSSTVWFGALAPLVAAIVLIGPEMKAADLALLDPEIMPIVLVGDEARQNLPPTLSHCPFLQRPFTPLLLQTTVAAVRALHRNGGKVIRLRTPP